MKQKKAARPPRAVLWLALVLIVAVAAGLWWVSRPVPSGLLRLVPVSYGGLPGWDETDAGPALAAFRRSCVALLKMPRSLPMGGLGYAGTVGDWQGVCSASRNVVVGPDGVRAWFESRFVPFQIRAGAQRGALLTGYYEPEIAASRVKRDAFAIPVYGLPRDLVTADLGLFRTNLSGIRIVGRVVRGQVVPFPTRADIDTNGLADAPVLLYANDPVSVFFLQIQGSGRARLENGVTLRLAYAGQNGQPYTPIGRTLIENGGLDRAHMSMQAIRAWLTAHRGEAPHVMESDRSYVFFRELPIGDPRLGSPGSEGVPLTPETSIAVDPAIHALGLPIFVATEAPAADPAGKAQPFNRLCVAQDTGGAIKGDLRADVFWGFGGRAEAIAGRMKSIGSLYVLLPKMLAGHMPAKFLATS